MASEYAIGIRVDRFAGLQSYAAAQGELIEDLSDELYTSGPVYYEFRGLDAPADFHERFCLKFMPWFYKNNPGAQGNQRMVSGTDACIPALWCEERTLIAYSKEGYDSKTWELPPNWKDVGKAAVSRIAPGGAEPPANVAVADGKLVLRVGAGEALKVGLSLES